jgi:hypothetical protein
MVFQETQVLREIRKHRIYQPISFFSQSTDILMKQYQWINGYCLIIIYNKKSSFLVIGAFLYFLDARSISNHYFVKNRFYTYRHKTENSVMIHLELLFLVCRDTDVIW